MYLDGFSMLSSENNDRFFSMTSMFQINLNKNAALLLIMLEFSSSSGNISLYQYSRIFTGGREI